MTTKYDIFQSLVEDATDRVIEQGTDNASERDLTLALMGWLHESIHSIQASNTGNRNSRDGVRGKVQQYSAPTLAGGGFVGILLLVIERIVG